MMNPGMERTIMMPRNRSPIEALAFAIVVNRMILSALDHTKAAAIAQDHEAMQMWATVVGGMLALAEQDIPGYRLHLPSERSER